MTDELPADETPGSSTSSDSSTSAGSATSAELLDVVAVLTAKPGSESIVRDALAALVAPTLAEDGCREYRLLESQARPGVFVTVEKWRAQADLDAHLQTPHVQAALATAGEHLASAPDIHPLTPVA